MENKDNKTKNTKKTKESKLKVAKKKYHFPLYGRTVLAETLAEATEQIKKQTEKLKGDK